MKQFRTLYIDEDVRVWQRSVDTGVYHFIELRGQRVALYSVNVPRSFLTQQRRRRVERCTGFAWSALRDMSYLMCAELLYRKHVVWKTLLGEWSSDNIIVALQAAAERSRKVPTRPNVLASVPPYRITTPGTGMRLNVTRFLREVSSPNPLEYMSGYLAGLELRGTPMYRSEYLRGYASGLRVRRQVDLAPTWCTLTPCVAQTRRIASFSAVA